MWVHAGAAAGTLGSTTASTVRCASLSNQNPKTDLPAADLFVSSRCLESSTTFFVHCLSCLCDEVGTRFPLFPRLVATFADACDALRRLSPAVDSTDGHGTPSTPCLHTHCASVCWALPCALNLVLLSNLRARPASPRLTTLLRTQRRPCQ